MNAMGTMTRRTAAMAMLLVPLLPKLGFAQRTPPEETARFIDTLGQQALTVLGAASLPLTDREARVRELLSRSIDFQTIGRFALGPAWRRASADQKSEYQRLFQEYVLRTYSRRLGGYAGETFRITGARALTETDALVSTEIQRPSGPPLAADWRVRGGTTGYKILDVMVSGVSMIQTQRSEFTAVVRRDGVDGLIAALRARLGRFSASPS